MRRRTAAIVVAVLAGLTSCTSDEADDGCTPCTSEVADVRAALEKVPEVSAVDRVAYAPPRNITRAGTLSIDLTIEAGAVDAARLAALEAAWRSDVTPLSTVLVALVTPDGEVTTQDGRFGEKSEAEVYEAKWGPRPVG